MAGLSHGALVAIVVVAVVLSAVMYAFKDKIPVLKHLPEITCGWCCGFGCLPADYMKDDRRPPPQPEAQTAEPVVEAEPVSAAPKREPTLAAGAPPVADQV